MQIIALIAFGIALYFNLINYPLTWFFLSFIGVLCINEKISDMEWRICIPLKAHTDDKIEALDRKLEDILSKIRDKED